MGVRLSSGLAGNSDSNDAGAMRSFMTEEFVITVTLPGTPEHFTRTCGASVWIGRSPEADIQLVHPLVSRRHVQISVQEDGDFLVSDLGSRNGTVVNDELVQNDARAVAGPAVIQVGPYMLQLAPSSLAEGETFLADRRGARVGRVFLDRGLRDSLRILLFGNIRLHEKSFAAVLPD